MLLYTYVVQPHHGWNRYLWPAMRNRHCLGYHPLELEPVDINVFEALPSALYTLLPVSSSYDPVLDIKAGLPPDAQPD